jgi:hypothetical protein
MSLIPSAPFCSTNASIAGWRATLPDIRLRQCLAVVGLASKMVICSHWLKKNLTLLSLSIESLGSNKI